MAREGTGMEPPPIFLAVNPGCGGSTDLNLRVKYRLGALVETRPVILEFLLSNPDALGWDALGSTYHGNLSSSFVRLARPSSTQQPPARTELMMGNDSLRW